LFGHHRHLLEVDGYAGQSEDCCRWCSHPAGGSVVLLLCGLLPQRGCDSGKSCRTRSLRLGIPAAGADPIPCFLSLCGTLLFRKPAAPQTRCHLISPNQTMVAMVPTTACQTAKDANHANEPCGTAALGCQNNQLPTTDRPPQTCHCEPGAAICRFPQVQFGTGNHHRRAVVARKKYLTRMA
jgi:hypothetical protein